MASIPGTSGEESWRAMPRPLSRFFSKGSSEMKQREKELEEVAIASLEAVQKLMCIEMVGCTYVESNPNEDNPFFKEDEDGTSTLYELLSPDQSSGYKSYTSISATQIEGPRSSSFMTRPRPPKNRIAHEPPTFPPPFLPTGSLPRASPTEGLGVSLPSLSQFCSQLASPSAGSIREPVVVEGASVPFSAPSQLGLLWTRSIPKPSSVESRDLHLLSWSQWARPKASDVPKSGTREGGDSQSSGYRSSYPSSYMSPYPSSCTGSYTGSSYTSSYTGSYTNSSQGWTRLAFNYRHRPKVIIAGIASLYGLPSVAAAFNHWDALRVASGVASMGTGTAVIPLQQVEGVPEKAWMWTFLAWGMCFLPYLWLKTWEIPDQLSYRRKFYIFSVILSSVHFIIGMSQGLEGTGSGFALYGPVVLTTCAYLVAFLFVPREASIGDIVSIGLDTIAIPSSGNGGRAPEPAGH